MIKYFLICLVLFFTSCKNKKIEECEYIGGVSIKRTNVIKKFLLPNDVKLKSKKLSIIKDEMLGKEFLYYLDKKNNLLIYDINTKILKYHIKIAQRGPNGFGKVVGFYPIKKDSILITSAFRYDLGIMNLKGDKIGKLFYDRNREYSRTRDNNDTHIYQQEGKLYFPMFLEGNWTTLREEDYKKYRTTLEYDLKDQNAQLVGMSLPYEENELRSKRHYNYSSKFKNGYIFTFASTHDIFFTEDFKNYKQYKCKSKNIERLSEYKYSGNFKKDLYNQLKSSEYSKVLWDPYRKYLYRFYKLKNEDIRRNDNLINASKKAAPFGIMILDEQLNILADQIMPTKYNWKDSFVSEKGLYISINHSDNPDMDVNYLSFELFEVK